MKIKLDENITVRLKPVLVAMGHECDTVLDEGLKGASDAEIWHAAMRDNRFLITQDLDFSDIRKFAPGTHAGILLVRIPDDEQPHLVEHISAWMTSPDSQSWSGCFIVGSPRRLRIIRPPEQLEL